jgi:hypothetical protein
MANRNWRDLCERIRQEDDPNQLMALVEELNRALEHRERELQYFSKERNRPSLS